MNFENPINKTLKEDVANFTAPLSKRQSDKFVININGHNNNTNNNKSPILNQPLGTPSNSSKNLIEIPENKDLFNYNIQSVNNNNYENKFNDNNKLMNSNSHNKAMDFNPQNNDNERRESNNSHILPNFNNNLNTNNNFKRRNTISHNNDLNIKDLNNRTKKPASQSEFYSHSNKNMTAEASHRLSLTARESETSKAHCDMKSRSNPLLQYITIGIKSNENKKINQNRDSNAAASNRSSRRKPVNSAHKSSTYNDNVINDFSVYASIASSDSPAAQKSEKIFDKGIFIVKDNYKTLLALFLLLGGSAYVYKLYRENPNLYDGLWNEWIKSFVSDGFFEKIKENLFAVCILTAVLISIVFIILKYSEQVRFHKIAEQDYKLIKQILEASFNKDDHNDLIGLFENNFVQYNAEKHNISEESYRRCVMPIMQEARMNEDLIEEAEILIQDQAQKVWRITKANIYN